MPKKPSESVPGHTSTTSRREFITRTVFAVGAAVVPTLITSTPAAFATPKQDVRPGTENPEASASPKPFPDASPSSTTISATPSTSPLMPGTSTAPTRTRTRDAVQQPADLTVEKSSKRYDFF